MIVKFSEFNNGMCPMCSWRKDCVLLHGMSNAVSIFGKPGNEDKVMEVVVYRCPEFKEKPELTDVAKTH